MCHESIQERNVQVPPCLLTLVSYVYYLLYYNDPAPSRRFELKKDLYFSKRIRGRWQRDHRRHWSNWQRVMREVGGVSAMSPPPTPPTTVGGGSNTTNPAVLLPPVRVGDFDAGWSDTAPQLPATHAECVRIRLDTNWFAPANKVITVGIYSHSDEVTLTCQDPAKEKSRERGSSVQLRWKVDLIWRTWITPLEDDNERKTLHLVFAAPPVCRERTYGKRAGWAQVSSIPTR